MRNCSLPSTYCSVGVLCCARTRHVATIHLTICVPRPRAESVWWGLGPALPRVVQTKPQIIILCFALLRISRHSFIIVLVASASPVEAGHSRTRAVTGLRGISQYPEKAPVRAFSLLEEPSPCTAKFREVRLPALLVTSATLGCWPPVKGTNGCCQLDASTENQLLSQWMVEIFY